MTICPHCGEEVRIPYEEISHFVRRKQALIGVARRKDIKEHVNRMAQKRWPRAHLHPKQEAILELSQQEDITKLTLEKIAERVGIEGPWRKNYVWQHLRKLREKGLLPEK